MGEKKMVPELRFKGFDDCWVNKKVGEVANFFDSKRIPIKDNDRSKMQGNYPYYGASGIIDYVNDYIFDGEYVLLGEDGANILTRSTRLAFLVSGKIWVNNHAHILQSKENNYFLAEVLERIKYDAYNTGTAQPKLNAEVCKAIRINLPSLPEQQKIASFLSTVDDQIELLTKRKELLEQYKKGAMQKIFSQEIRFAGDGVKLYPDWEEKKLGDVCIKYSKKTTENNSHTILTSSRKGLFRQVDYFNNREVASKDNIGYHVLPLGYITYRQMTDDGLFKFNQNQLELGAVSPAYPVFKVNGANDYFILTCLNDGVEFKSFALKEKQGGTRMTIPYSKLATLKINLPCLEEQRKIANFLSSIDAQIDQVSNRLDGLKTWKKGLLQKMFV